MRWFLQLVLCLCVSWEVTGDDTCDPTQCEWNYWKHYLQLKCIPVYRTGGCCPFTFTCPKLEKRDPNKCYVDGEPYDAGASIPAITEKNPCRIHCRCENRFGPSRVNCVNVECPEIFGHRPPGDCRRISEEGKCCARFDCDNSKPLHRCKYGDRSYREGETIYFDSEPCKSCTCTPDFSGPSGPGCKDYQCEDLDNIVYDGCTPLYYPGACCPIGKICEKDLTKFKLLPTSDFDNDNKPGRCPPLTSTQPPGAEVRCPEFCFQDSECPFNHKCCELWCGGHDCVKPITDETETCHLGNATFSVGQKIHGDFPCVECSCSVPPLLTCLQVSHDKCGQP